MGSSRLPEVLINNVYFRREKGSTLQLGEVREIGVFVQERTELLPGGLR